MSSLYDDLDLKAAEKRSVKDRGVEGWSSGIKLLQSQIQLKKATALKGMSSKKMPVQTASVAPVVDLSSKKKGGSEDTMPAYDTFAKTIVAADELHVPLPWGNYKGTTLERASSLLFGEMEVKDEYNPLLPNDYDLIRKQRGPDDKQVKQRERDLEERERRVREKERERESRLAEEEDDRNRRMGGAAIAPPTFLVEEDKKIFEEPQMPPPPPSQKGLGVAAKIMEKYGYRQGQGLGKQEQGMSTALEVQKTSKSTAKIVHERDRNEFPQPAPITDILKNPTKVVLLQNMVGPGEVDEELEPEIRQECSKYGDVYGCTAYEVPNPVNDEDAVRVFLEFSKVEQAIKAVVDLNGRYFAGRMVRACFYDVDKYRRKELALDV